MSLSDDLARLAATPGPGPLAVRPAPLAPKGWEPGVKYDPAGPMLVTSTGQTANVQADPAAWRKMVEDLGLNIPDGWQVRLVEAKYDPAAWTRQAQGEDATTIAVWRYRFAVEPALEHLSIDDLVKRVRRAKPPKARADASTNGCARAFVAAMGDTQIGKVDGDGPEGTIDRVLLSIEGQKKRIKDLRRLGHRFDAIYLPWLGDCVEGFNSQGGANALRTVLPLTEQVRIVRRLMLHQIETIAPLAARIVLPSIPGNHDDGVRVPGGKGPATRFDDSWAIEAAVQVGDALAMNSAAYGHVSIVVPQRDELTLTLDIAGTLTGLAHGHQMRPGKAEMWWAEQAHGMQPIGSATMLWTAHLHHLMLRQGGAKTHVQVPAFEGESTYWRHLHGQVAPTGSATMLVGGGGWSDLAVV